MVAGSLDASSNDDVSNRKEILEMLQLTMDHLESEIQDTEPDTLEEERLEIKRIRTLGYLANQYRKIKRDTDLDEMEEELELVQAATNLLEE